MTPLPPRPLPPAPPRLSFPHAPFCPTLSLPLSLMCTQAVIDQVEGLITFKAAEQPLQQWDRNIAALCQSVNQIVDEAAARGVRLPAAAPS